MAIKIVPHALEYKQAVEDFNRRMHEGGSSWGFYVDPVPTWLAPCDDAKAWREYHLALEDGQAVRGAYALKPQQWKIGGEIQWVTDWQGPFSEGAVTPRYSTLAMRLIRDMQKKRPLLYSWGHGDNEQPIVQLLRTLKWHLHPTPFCFRVVHPYAFLRKNNYLRQSSRRARLLDLLAYSGVGSVGVHGLHALLRARSLRLFSTQAVVEPAFGDWTDALWQRASGEYSALAVRDAAMMNALIPRQGWPAGTRLRVVEGSLTVGWAVVLHKKMQDEPRFGSLTVGLIADCFASPRDAGKVVYAAYQYLVDQGVDVVYSNQAHPGWVRGFEENGFLILRDRRLMALSPKLCEALQPLHKTLTGLHLTNMDGHGPNGFE